MNNDTEIIEDTPKLKSRKRPYVVAIVLALALVIIITATSYAYFTAQLNGTSNNTVVTTGAMEIEFSDGAQVNLQNALPGDYVEKTFSVENKGTLDTVYDIYMSDLINEFVDKSDLVYTLTSNDGGQNINETQVGDVPTKIVSNKQIGVGDKHNYTLRIEFKETNDNQDDNKGKSFSTIIRVNEVQNAVVVPSYKPQYGTYIAVNNNETHKGVVYLDPTDLSATCNETLASQNVNSNGTPTEIKTGCMKWYIFNDSGDKYKMILAHNTTAKINWNNSNSIVSYENSNVKPVVDDLVSTSGWKVTPRLITAQEVAAITGKTGFNAADDSSQYYFDTNSQTKATFDSTTRSRYDWLYNNLNKCKTDTTDYGCNIEDGNTYQLFGTSTEGKTWGYWTNTTLGNDSYMWAVYYINKLVNPRADRTDIGIRPVIEVARVSS